MNTAATQTRRWLIIAVMAHLIISIVHGAAHSGAHVPLSYSANLFVMVVILAGPLVGLAVMWSSLRAGSWLIAATMSSSLVFGLVNHFVFISPDHVGQVDPQWQPLFAVTALLLAATEAAGSGLAIRLVRRRTFALRNTLDRAGRFGYPGEYRG